MSISTSLSTEEARPPAHPSYSTYWMPLDEPRRAWAAFGEEATLPPTLSATAHAFFALSHETKALKHVTFAAEQRRQYPRFAKEADFWYSQAERALFEATHHWSRAACALDTLTPKDLASDELMMVRALSRAARFQQERLWKLTDEVRAEIAAFRREHQQPYQAAPIPCLDQPAREEATR